MKVRQKIELKKQRFQCIINLNTTICKHEAQRSNLNTTICRCDHRSINHTDMSQQSSISDQCRSHSNKTKSARNLNTSHRSIIREHQSNRSLLSKTNNKCAHRTNKTCDHKPKSLQSINREPYTVKLQYYSRDTPQCLREKCRGLLKLCRFQDNKKQRDHVRDMTVKHHHFHRNHCRMHHSRRAGRYTRNQKHKQDSLLSPISSSPLKDDLNHLYEDISNESLDKVLETPKSYKNIKYGACKVESKLDTLIKRTKERERKLVAQSRRQPNHSISSMSNISSGECPMDLDTMDSASLHSQSTLVLEESHTDFIYPNTENYNQGHLSPTKTAMNNNIYKHSHPYSPGSPLPDYLDTPKKIQFYEGVDIKSEPIDIQIYSPTFDYTNEEIKKEYDYNISIKSEPYENMAWINNLDVKKRVE